MAHDPNHVLISGGASYGNLGDDAILMATLQLVLRHYPKAAITVMAYGVEATRRLLPGGRVAVIPSIHRQLVGDYTEKLVLLPGRKPPSVQERAHVQQVVATVLDPARTPALVQRFQAPFQPADLFVQFGGGYFNGMWKDSAVARCLELLTARMAGKRILVIGQGIGPFPEPALRSLAYRALSGADLVSVRDPVSQAELQAAGIAARVIPDTVAADAGYDFPRQPVIALVGNGALAPAARNLVAKGVAEAARRLGWGVKVLVSRLFASDLAVAQNVVRLCKKESVPTVAVVPSSWVELQSELGSSAIVVSQNLHPLVLGFRAGVPGVALNTERKFLAFMSHSGQSDRILPEKELAAGRLTQLILAAKGAGGAAAAARKSLAEAVVRDFTAALDEAAGAPNRAAGGKGSE